MLPSHVKPYDTMCVLQAETSLTPTKSQSTSPPPPQVSNLPDNQPKPKRPTAELMDELRKAQANGSGKSMVLPVDANGNNIEDIMKEIAGNVLQEAMPDLMQQMGASERNPIMQASSGILLPLCNHIIRGPAQGLPLCVEETDLLVPVSLCGVGTRCDAEG